MLDMIPNIPCYERHPRNAIEKVPSPMVCQFQLRDLDLYRCSRLGSLTDSMYSWIYPLLCLDISWCSGLRELPKNLDNLIYLKKLIAYGSGLNKLPDSLCNLKNLEYLNVCGCVSLCGLPQNLGNLKSLKQILAYRTGIKELPVSINDLRELRTLDLHGCKGLKLPMWTAGSPLQVFMTGNFPHLGFVNLSYCEISEFPSSLCYLTSLWRLEIDGNNFESIPKYINQLSSLKWLNFRDCNRLKYMPDYTAQVFDLWSEMDVVDFGNCINLNQRQLDKMMGNIVSRRMGAEWFELCIPGSELPGKMMYQNNNGSSLSFSFRPLKDMDFLEFYVGAVCKFYDDVNFVAFDVDIIDESGHRIDSAKHVLSFPREESGDAALQSTHVLLQGWEHGLTDTIKCNEYYTFVLKFYAVEMTTDCCNSDAIIKCGFHPKHCI